MSKDRNIIVDGMSYGERELAQLIRRRMMTQEVKNKKKYTRKSKHKKVWYGIFSILLFSNRFLLCYIYVRNIL